MSDEAVQFIERSYAVVRNLISEADASVISRYMEYALKSALYTDRGGGPASNDPSKYARYADPLMEVMLVDSRRAVEAVVSKELLPTYSYSRVYVEGDDLERHVDRPSCEYSVTVNVACDGEPWPIWMQHGDAEPTKVTLNPGDAVVYKGCDVHHWRSKMERTRVNAQFMLHYVDKNGPFAEYKWDKRPGAGYPSVWRS
jgi:hypothetical protein